MKNPRDRFLELVENKYPRRLEPHKSMLDLIEASPALCCEFKFNSKSNPTYHICPKGDDSFGLLWVHADGKLYVRWHLVKQRYGASTADTFVEMWTGTFKDRGIYNSSGDGGELETPLTIELAQRICDKVERAVGDFDEAGHKSS